MAKFKFKYNGTPSGQPSAGEMVPDFLRANPCPSDASPARHPAAGRADQQAGSPAFSVSHFLLYPLEA